MFPKHYELVIVTFFIFCNMSTDSISYQDSILPALRRYDRQTEFNDMCLIPIYPFHTNYKILGKLGPTYKSGDNVPNFAILRIICDKGYKINPFAQNISVCLEGIWTPRLTNCIRACPSLKATISTNVNCMYNDSPLDNCYDPVEETAVVVSCNPLYEVSTKDNNLGHVCLDGKWEPYIPQCNPICGQKRPIGTVNIINGADTIRGNYPWHVGIYNATNKDYLCGGAMITRNVILSAAHCFADYYGKVLSRENYFVAAGKYYRIYDHNSDDYAQYAQIHKINIPERYKGITGSESFDIAVLVLKNPFSLSRAVQPVCIELNEQLRQLHLSSHSIGIVTGWGYTQEGAELADVLKELEIPHIPYEKCYDEIPMNFKRYFTIDKICGGYKNSATSICSGDSGGGLVFINRITDRFYIKGIVSTSPATVTRQCDSNQYSLFTSIAAHIQFIRDVITKSHLRYSVECKYDQCGSEQQEQIRAKKEEEEDKELLKNVDEVEEIAKNLKNEFLKTFASNGNIDDLCAPVMKCSCLYIVFTSTSDMTGKFTKDVVATIQKVVPQFTTEQIKDDETCKAGASCYSIRTALLKVAEATKEYLAGLKKIIQEESDKRLINVEIFEDYEKCSYTTFLKALSGRIREILKSKVNIHEKVNITYGLDLDLEEFEKVIVTKQT